LQAPASAFNRKGRVRICFSSRNGRQPRRSGFPARSADEIEVNLGSLDAPDQLMPTYECWVVRRESWLPPFPLAKHYDRDRDASGRFED